MPTLPSLTPGLATALPELTVPAPVPTPPAPQLVYLAAAHATDLGCPPAALHSTPGLSWLLGHDADRPVATAYAGHQFGHYTPVLGDGRALLLGDVSGRELQLKGSGPTAFARGGDGYATLAAILREYAIGEFFAATGVPTTRTLAVLTTGQKVIRTRPEPGAIGVRTAASHLRIGTVQLARHAADTELLERLICYTRERLYPECTTTAELFAAIRDRLADLVAAWMQLGFVHGVLNTDNCALSGEALDFGPCAFLDRYDPEAVFSSIDTAGRYRYSQQPRIMQWNLYRLAEALLPAWGPSPTIAHAEATALCQGWEDSYTRALAARRAHALGVAHPSPETTALAEDFLAHCAAGGWDYTTSWRALAPAVAGESALELPASWWHRWRALRPDAGLITRVTPLYIPRNHLLQGALDAATEGQWDAMTTLLDRLTQPYTEVAGMEHYALPEAALRGPFTSYCGT